MAERSLRRLVERITGKELHRIRVDGDPWQYVHDTAIEVSSGPGYRERVVHEVLHWIVASDAQRADPWNLGLEHRDGPGSVPSSEQEQQERAVCQLERLLYGCAGRPMPATLSCGPRLERALSGERLAAAVARADAVGWPVLIDLVRAR